MTNKNEYPIFVETEIVSDKRFNGELCHHTGRAMIDGETTADIWNEYKDSEGNLHYGR